MIKNVLLFTIDYFLGDMSDPVVQLWVKAGSNLDSVGGDPISQQLFMILLLKGENPKCRFDVIVVNEAKPPPDFKSVSDYFSSFFLKSSFKYAYISIFRQDLDMLQHYNMVMTLLFLTLTRLLST